MKLFVKSVVVATVISIIFSLIPFSAQCKNISGEVFRLHILANSDLETDQQLKLKVRDRVLKYTESIFKNSDNKQDAEIKISENLQDIANVAQDEIYKNGFNYSVKVQMCNMYFNTRYYENVTMPSGMYDALRIIIGEGKGKNWWCVMYPSMCIGSATDYNALKENVNEDEYKMMTENTYEYKFKLVEYFNKICDFFS